MPTYWTATWSTALKSFDSKTLANDEAVSDALERLNTSLTSGTLNHKVFLEGALEQPYRLEFILSALSEAAYTALATWILEQCTTVLAKYSATSITSILLNAASNSLLHLPYPETEPKPADLGKRHHAICNSNAALIPLLSMQLPSSSSRKEPNTVSIEEELPSGFKVKGTQAKHKHARKESRVKQRFDDTPLKRVCSSIPSTRGEVDALGETLLNEQKRDLEYFLGIFRRPNLAPVFKNLFLPRLNEVVTSEYLAMEECMNLDDRNEEDPLAETPSAFPMVQPMKAALYFDSADGFGEWRILISTRADRNLREARNKDPTSFKIYYKKIKELSRGHFSDDNQKRLTGINIPVPIYEAKMTRDSRLVYQIDCIPEFDGSHVERQVIRVFGIYTHAQLDKRFWDSMGFQLARRGREYRDRCTFRQDPYHKGDNVYPPASFPPTPVVDLEESASDAADMRKEDLEELHALLVLEKFVTFSQALLSSIIADQDASHVFHVSPQEQEIIEHCYSCYVQGRSGTGKTTTMLFKMLGIENSWQQSAPETSGLARPRQLFVTQSRVLADKVEDYFTKLLESLAMESRTTTDISKLLERKKNREEAGLVDREEAVQWREDLPTHFKDLNDGHFPMFITFDKLSSMLETEKDDGQRQENMNAVDVLNSPTTEFFQRNGNEPASDYMQRERDRFVSFRVFMEEYWPHLPQPLTKNLDPSLVFSEFMGVIKGSEQTLRTENHALDRASYTGLSHRTQSTFSSKREEIYNLFEAYLRMKKKRGEYDAADRTHAILDELSKGTPGQKLDFLYVDEVQDNLLIDSKLLRLLCRNPDGLFWAGDTAQTISVGSSFRFDDLKSFLHRIEGALKSQRAPQEPKAFHLLTNYRSHGGIVKCAHSVVQLITYFWPYSIDSLAEEKGIVDGIKPVFFSGWDQDNVRYESFLFGSAGSHIEFGAQQCILVRNDAARDKLREQVGDIGLIMTLYESKGLEFNDVLLYNFFEDSTVDVSQWRVVLNAVAQENRDKIQAPSFQDIKHAGVCSELKFLYVAITRARKNLWIVDRSERGESMRTYWTAKNLVQNCNPETDMPHLAATSTPEEWGEMAVKLFENKRYFQAMHCFERANKARERRVAYAYYLREQARGMRSDTRANHKARNEAYIATAQAFMTCGHEAIKERTEYFRIAGKSYLTVEDIPKAAGAYVLLGDFTQGAQLYRKAGMFEQAVALLHGHKEEVNSAVAERIMNVSRLHYFNKGNFKGAPAGLFESVEEKLEFLEDYDLDIARAGILLEAGRYAEAADIYLQEGSTLDAIRAFIKDDAPDLNSWRRAKDCAMDELRKCLSFGIRPEEESEEMRRRMSDLFKLLGQVNNVVARHERPELMVLHAIENDQTDQLKRLSLHVLKEKDCRKSTALLALDRFFDDLESMEMKTKLQIQDILHALHIYAKLIQNISTAAAPIQDKDLQLLFAFKPVSDEQIALLDDTWLYRAHYRYASVHIPDTDEVVLSPLEFVTLLRDTLAERLRSRILLWSDRLLASAVFDPCMIHASTGNCKSPDCPYQHIINTDVYNERISVVLDQILLLQVVSTLPPDGLCTEVKIQWLDRLYEALNPPSYKLGSMANLRDKIMEEYDRGIVVVRGWIREAFYSLDPYDYGASFLSLFVKLLFVGSGVDRAQIWSYVNRPRCVAVYRPPYLLRPPKRDYVLHELISLMKSESLASLSHGVLLVRHILEKPVKIHAGALCHILDRLCGSFIIAQSFQQRKDGFHDILLPRSWAADLIDGNALLFKNTETLELFVPVFRGLLHLLYAGGEASDHLLYEGKSIKHAPMEVRHMFIAQLCRNMALLGHNLGVKIPQMRVQIQQIMKSLRAPDRQFPESYRNFVQAAIWFNIYRALLNSSAKLEMDELVHLISKGKDANKIPGTRRISFLTPKDIQRSLDGTRNKASKPALNPLAANFVPSPSILLAQRAEAGGPATDDDDDDDDDDDAGAEAEEDLTADDEPQNSEFVESPSADINAIIESNSGGDAVTVVDPETIKQQKAAAEVMWSYYERIRRGRRELAPIPASRQRFFGQCLEYSKTIQWANASQYRYVFLGPLPHLLACLEWTRKELVAEKKKAQKQLGNPNVKHQEYDNLMDRQHNLKGLLRQIEAALKALDPTNSTSSIHGRKEVNELKKHVTQLNDVLQQIPSSKNYEDLQNEFKLAWAGIVKESKQPDAKKEKPTLNTEDLD